MHNISDRKMCVVIPRILVGAVPARKPLGAELSPKMGQVPLSVSLYRHFTYRNPPSNVSGVASRPGPGDCPLPLGRPVAQRFGVGARPKRDFGSLLGNSSTGIWRSPLSTRPKPWANVSALEPDQGNVPGREYRRAVIYGKT